MIFPPRGDENDSHSQVGWGENESQSQRTAVENDSHSHPLVENDSHSQEACDSGVILAVPNWQGSANLSVAATQQHMRQTRNMHKKRARKKVLCHSGFVCGTALALYHSERNESHTTGGRYNGARLDDRI